MNPDETIVVAESLKSIKVPTLLIWGKEDRFQPWVTVGLRIKALLPDSDDVVIKNTGHFLPIEQPDVYVETMLSWKRAINLS